MNKKKIVSYNDYEYVVGIDPGTNTGFAVWDRTLQKFAHLGTHSVILAQHMLREQYLTLPTLLVIEDARTRGGSKETMLGAGSVRRDCSIWQEFADFYHFDVLWRSTPKRGAKTTKLKPEVFKNLTGYTGRTSNHARDAAMLVWKT